MALAVIQRIRDAGDTAVLLVEQYLDFARSLGDTYYIMERGSIVAEGETQNLTDEIVHTHLTV